MSVRMILKITWNRKGKTLKKSSPDLKHLETESLDSNSCRYLHIWGLHLDRIIIETAFLMLLAPSNPSQKQEIKRHTKGKSNE